MFAPPATSDMTAGQVSDVFLPSTVTMGAAQFLAAPCVRCKMELLRANAAERCTREAVYECGRQEVALETSNNLGMFACRVRRLRSLARG